MQRVNPNCTALEQKQFQEKQDIDININDIRESHLRCGEIYMNGTENFKFVCILCEKSFFTNIEEFVVHVTNCELTTENLKLDAVEIVNIEQVTLKEELIDSPDMETENSELEDPVEEFLSYNESEDCEPNNIEPKTLETNNSTSDKTVKTFSCDYCNRKYCSNDSLRRHLKQTHSGSVMKKICEKSKNKPSLKREEFLCEFCDKKYIHKDSLRRHLKNEHPGMVFKQNNYLSCDFPNCKCKFKSKESLEIHINYDHKAIDMFISNSKLQVEELENGEKDFSEKSSTNLNQSPKVDDHNCRFCGRCFISPLDRYTHERIHAGIKPYKCRFCDKFSRTETLRNVHELTHQGVKPYKCHLCDIAFFQKPNLKAHIKRHLGQKNLPCKFCGKLFFVNSERDKHEKIHTGEKPFQCSECGKCYISLSRLNVHIKRKHSVNSTNAKQFKCDHCGKAFSSKKSLKRHYLTHTGEKPFSCEMCNSKFFTKDVLRQHMKIHSNVAEYTCKICGKGFKQKPGLYCHMKVHGEVLS